MKTILLQSVAIHKYKSFESKQSFDVADDVTVLVGKNESGKTASLEAVAKTRYFAEDPKFKFDPVQDYPRKEKKQYDKTGVIGSVITCTYRISDDLLTQIAKDIGEQTLLSVTFSLETKYDNKSSVLGLKANLDRFLEFKTGEFGISDPSEKAKLLATKDTAALKALVAEEQAKLTQLQQAENAAAAQKVVQAKTLPSSKLSQCLPHLTKYLEAKPEVNWEPLEYYVYHTWVSPYLPKFLYYDEYYALPSRVDISQLQANQLDTEELKTSKALFELADIKINDLVAASNFEAYIAELEATANLITQQLFQYWTTNKDLRVRFQMDRQFIGNQPRNILDIRVENLKHMMSLPLGNRSKGFNWFFSFIVWFSKIQEDKKSNYVLLLDEPGLNLHAAAQADLLRFIEDLSARYQIIYTTHSPFMIDPNRLTKVRTVVDAAKGSEISDSLQQKDSDTLFPLQAALGYDIAQNLFISKSNLLVEGPSDLVFLSLMSNLLEQSNRTGLKEGVTIVPVGGLDKVATFIALLKASKLNLACLLDSFIDQAGKQRLDDLIKHKIIKEKHIRFFDEFADVDGGKADIEDLFAKEEYLRFFNEAFPELGGVDISKIKNLKDPILPQISLAINKPRFNHYRVANLMATKGIGAKDLKDDTLARFEKVFNAVNVLF